MEATAKKQRRSVRRKPADSSMIRIEVRDGTGTPRWLSADVVDMIDGGFGLKLTTPLKYGSDVVVHGKLGENRMTDSLTAGVRWCIAKADGTFRAGLEFLDSRSSLPLDCYEVMQLSPNADSETISRVFRLLASRYHPDNAESGNSEKFIRLSEAHQILSDPEKRARYDVCYREAMRLRWQIVEAGSAEERCKRFDGVKSEVKMSGTRSEKANFTPSVGTLCGWNAAVRHP